MRLKTLLHVSIGVLSGLLIGIACGSGLVVKVYDIIPDKGLVRKKGADVIPFDKAAGYKCMSPSDTEALITAYKTCRDRGAVPSVEDLNGTP